MSITKNITLDTHQQLLDLNGDTTNFELTFTAKSMDGSPFYVVVVDQTTLDNSPELEFKKADGIISGTIVSDKNVYQNYFLCMKSDSNCEVSVTIDKKEIQPTPPPPVQTEKPADTSNKGFSINWKYIMYGLIIVGILVLVWYYTRSKKKFSMDLADSNVFPSNSQFSNNNFTIPPSPPMPSPGNTPEQPSGNSNLLDRLNKLSMKI